MMLLLFLLAAFLGVAGATSVSCLVGLTQATSTWCGFQWLWPIGMLVAAPTAIFVGAPTYFLLRRLGYGRWWHFAAAGTVMALPMWLGLAEPFQSVRWQQSALFDTINYLGSGTLGALAFWFLQRGKSAGEL